MNMKSRMRLPVDKLSQVPSGSLHVFGDGNFMLKLLAFGVAYLQKSLHLFFPDVHVVGGFAANLEGNLFFLSYSLIDLSSLSYGVESHDLMNDAFSATAAIFRPNDAASHLWSVFILCLW